MFCSAVHIRLSDYKGDSLGKMFWTVLIANRLTGYFSEQSRNDIVLEHTQ